MSDSVLLPGFVRDPRYAVDAARVFGLGAFGLIEDFQLYSKPSSRTMMTLTSERKLAENRLKMLQFAETLGNVSEACWKLGVSWSQFCEYKKRFE